MAYWRSEQLEKSVPLFEEVLKQREALLGRQASETQRTLANLGVNYKDAGRLQEAIPLLEEAHQTARSYPPLRWVAGQLIEAYVKAGENAKLADLLLEHLAKARTEVPKDSPQLAGLLVLLGQSLLQQEKWAEAEPILRECLAIRENTQPNLWNTFTAQAMLGWSLLGQKKYDEAEPLLLVGYEGMKQRKAAIPEPGKVRLPEALDRLIELYTATDRPEEAAKWQAERAKYAEVAPMPGEKK